jgi:hypothetical protein
MQAYKNRKQPIPSCGLGQQDDAIALSVSGHVQKLIEEATNEKNLAQMFIGYSPPSSLSLPPDMFAQAGCHGCSEAFFWCRLVVSRENRNDSFIN